MSPPRLPRWSLRASTLRGRLALITALAVFVAITLSGVATVAITVRVLHDQIDTALGEGVGGPPSGLSPSALSELCVRIRGGRGTPGSSSLVLLLAPDGTACTPPGGASIVLTERDRATASTGGRGGLRDGVSTAGEHLRVVVRPLGGGYAVLVGRSLGELDHLTQRLRGLLGILSVLGALFGLALGLIVARAGLRPLDRLTEAVEEVARTNDLALRIDLPAGRSDEVSRLAGAFNAMIAALAGARERQAQLVADAGHELRTPLTSLRTNIDLLVRSDHTGRSLPPDQRAALLASLTAQLEELSHLVGELVVLAKHEPAPDAVAVHLDAVVAVAVDRARRRAGDRRVTVTANEPWVVMGDGPALERAVVNLLDNALKFSPAGSAVIVHQTGGAVTVDDEGRGVPVEQREAAFARFWRGDDARGMPGSGLGLAIVADVAATHDGTARLAAAPGGGTRAVLRLPGTSPPDGGTVWS